MSTRDIDATMSCKKQKEQPTESGNLLMPAPCQLTDSKQTQLAWLIPEDTIYFWVPQREPFDEPESTRRSRSQF